MSVFDLMAKISLDTSEYDRGLKSAQSGISSFGSKVKSGFGRIAKIGGAALVATTGAVIAFGKKSIDAGAAFDSSMSQVAATMGKTTDELAGDIGSVDTAWGQFTGNLREYAQFMGSKTAFSATQAADALNYMALAGYDVQTSMEMLPNVLNLAAAGGMELATASDMVTDAQSALGLTLEETTTMVDMMAKASSKSNTSVAQLGEAFLTVGGTANVLTGGTNELSTALGILADNGIKGSEGGTHLRNVLLALTSPTDKAAATLEDLGVTAVDVATGNLRPLEDIMLDLSDSLDGLGEADKAAIISDIFNKTDIAAVNAMLGTSKERWDELSAAIDDSAGAAQAMADTQLDNLNGDITLFKSALEGAQIAISDELTPTLRGFVQEGTDGLSRLTDAFKNGGIDEALDVFAEIVSEGAEKLLKATPKFLAVGGKLLLAVGKGVIRAIPSVVSSISGQLPTAIQPIVDKAGEMADKVMAAIDAKFPALGALIHHIADIARTAIDNIKAFWAENGTAILAKASEIWNGIKNAIHTAIEGAALFISGFIGEVEHLWKRFGRRITDIASAYVEFLQAIFERLKQGVGLVLAGIKAFWDTYGNQIMNIATKVWRFIGNVISQALNIIKKVIKTATAVIKGDWTSALEGIKSITSSVWNLIKYVISNVLNAIKAVISTAWGVIKSIVSIALEAIKSKVESVWNTIKEKISKAINSAKDAVNTAIEAIKGYFASIVPSTITSKFESIKKGISSAINGAKDAVSSAIESIKGILNTTLSFPKIKVPHFSVTGGQAPWGIGGAGSPPKIDIQWYAKAMKDAYLLSGASIFGTMGGKFLGGGEAGNEILIGEQKALSMISAASGGAEIVALLEEIFRYLRTGMPSVLRDALADGLSFEIDGREFGRAVRAYAE